MTNSPNATKADPTTEEQTTPARQATSRGETRRRFNVTQVLATGFRTYGVAIALLVLAAVVGIANPVFLTSANLLDLTSQWAAVGIAGVGMTFIMLTGGFDLSVGAVYGLCSVVAAKVGNHEPASIAFAASVGVGTLCGTLNGLLVVVCRINAFIATLGTSLAIAGVALVWTHDTPVLIDPSKTGFETLGTGRLWDIPYSGLLMIGLFIVGGWVLARTTYGQSVYAVGGNREAARLSGIPTGVVEASTYIFTGFCVGLAGAVSASALASGQANLDPNYVFDVITIVVLGGTSLTGGVGAMWRTAVGLGIIATLRNGFNLLNLDANYQSIVSGVILIVAVGLDAYTRRRRQRPAATAQATEGEHA